MFSFFPCPPNFLNNLQSTIAGFHNFWSPVFGIDEMHDFWKNIGPGKQVRGFKTNVLNMQTHLHWTMWKVPFYFQFKSQNIFAKKRTKWITDMPPNKTASEAESKSTRIDSAAKRRYWKPLKGGRAKTSESFQPRSPPIFTRKMIWEGWKEMWECERDEDILDSGRPPASQSRDDQSPGDAPSRGQVDLLITLKVTLLRKNCSRGVREGSC